MKIRETLTSLLERHDMTVAQLSRKANVPKQNIHNWLNGLKAKDVEQVKRVADVFGVSLDFIYFGIGSNRLDFPNEHKLEGVWEVLLRRPGKS